MNQKLTTIKVLVELLKEYSKKGWQRWVIVAIAAMITLLVVTSCQGLWVKGNGTNNYEYEYRKEIRTNDKEYGIQNSN